MTRDAGVDLQFESDWGDLSDLPTPGRRYSSKGIRDRKQRILVEAQKLVEQLGVEGFTIRELSHRAQVAPRTLYNSFGAKEDIIAAAIEHFFLSLLDTMPPAPPPHDILRLVERARLIAEQIIRLRRYSTAMIGVFFSPTSDNRIHASLVRISGTGTVQWLREAEAAHILRPLNETQLTALADLAVNAGYANVGDWVSRRISDHEYKRRSQVNILLISFAYLRSEHQRPVRKIIDRLFADRPSLVESEAPAL